MDVSYAEDFWQTFNYLLKQPNITTNGDLTFFKKDIRPEWEDTENRMGGCWVHCMSSQHLYQKVDDLWLETLLALIGDSFCDSNLINQANANYLNNKSKNEHHICDYLSGTILMHRGKNDKVALWTKNYKDEQTTRLIG